MIIAKCHAPTFGAEKLKLLMMCQNLHWPFEAVSKSSGNDNISARKWLPE